MLSFYISSYFIYIEFATKTIRKKEVSAMKKMTKKELEATNGGMSTSNNAPFGLRGPSWPSM